MKWFSLILLLLSFPAEAQDKPQGCVPYEELSKFLRKQFEEIPVLGWVATQGTSLSEVWFSESNQTLTLVIRPGNDLGCIVGKAIYGFVLEGIGSAVKGEVL